MHSIVPHHRLPAEWKCLWKSSSTQPNFRGFRKATRVYDEFPISAKSPSANGRRGWYQPLRFWLLPQPPSIREKNEKKPATFTVVGYLNSRSANLGSSFNGSGFYGLRGSRPRNHRLEQPPRYLLPACHGGTGRARAAGPSLLAATPSPIVRNAAGGGDW